MTLLEAEICLFICWKLLIHKISNFTELCGISLTLKIFDSDNESRTKPHSPEKQHATELRIIFSLKYLYLKKGKVYPRISNEDPKGE
jgi:hypothetical protein